MVDFCRFDLGDISLTVLCLEGLWILGYIAYIKVA